VFDVCVSKRRDIPAATRFFDRLLKAHGTPDVVVTDLAPALGRVVRELIPMACHITDKHANNRIGADHVRLKARLKPMRGLKTDRTASIVMRGHAFLQNLRRSHYALGTGARSPQLRIAAAFDELAPVI
jgi:transposase-like protein